MVESRSTPEWREYYKARYREQKKKIRSQKSDQLCLCGCGEYTELAIKTDSRRGIKKGEPLSYILNHHPIDHLQTKAVTEKRNKANSSFESKLKKSKGMLEQLGSKSKTTVSPYIPEQIVRFNKQSGYWNCRIKRGGKLVGTHHAKAVWEYYNGPTPEGFEIHHIDNKHSELFDDRPENLVAIPREWNRDYIPVLMKGFGLDSETVTKIYLEVNSQEKFKGKVFEEVAARLLKVLRIPN